MTVEAPLSARAERVRRAHELKAEGLNQREIGVLMGASRATVSALFSDPDLSKQKKRRERYAQPCPRGCGRTMDGSGGLNGARPDRCAQCALEDRAAEPHKWSREVVIDAIQRFAAVHGRPPVSTEWVRTDPVNNYPPRSAVYRSTTRGWAPFASWADAVEAAGFPRPYGGTRRGRAWKERVMVRVHRVRGRRGGEAA